MRSAARSTISPTSGAAPRRRKRRRSPPGSEEIDALYAGHPRAPGRLARCASRWCAIDLRRDDFHAVIDGMEMDAAEEIRAPDLATLDLYCGRVAGAVGHLSVHVFGDPSAAAHRGRRLARPRVAAHQHSARSRRGRAARPALSAARNPRTPRHPTHRPARRCCGTRRCRRCAATSRRSPKAHFAEAEQAMRALLAAGDAAGGGDGRVLSRDARCAAALGLARPEPRVSLSKRRNCGWCCATGCCDRRGSMSRQSRPADAPGRSMSSAPGSRGSPPPSISPATATA